MLHVFAALAEFERNIIRERTQAGLRMSACPAWGKVINDGIEPFMNRRIHEGLPHHWQLAQQ